MIDKNKKYKTKSGCEVRIYATDGDGDYPIHGAVKYKDNDYWTLRKWSDKGNESWEKLNDLIEVSPYEDFKIDDKVLVWNEGDHEDVKRRRYFAGIGTNGKPLVFVEGSTSWSSNGRTIPFDYCEKMV